MSARFYLWKLWNRTRYYWPQAQSRKRAIAMLQAAYNSAGVGWKPRAPWWWPL